ncbi:hypothetical protein C7S16_5264 [Burkholderia thailandensis]|uniref:Uncharacterized protein n=1 Tax=Burkholderia thailandensis TaxID=57975 RepID=A0AAW9CV96_BURTH|nr:hypothetical protein [Burkholderia thailandensis]MDW9252933.1 hypothetical protein [Burkholderia thailandensis]
MRGAGGAMRRANLRRRRPCEARPTPGATALGRLTRLRARRTVEHTSRVSHLAQAASNRCAPQ